MAGIHQKLFIKADAESIYQAVTSEEGLKSWFARQTTAKEEVGFINTFTFGTFVNEMKINSLTPGKHVEWICTRSIEEWLGTTVSFDLESTHEKTILRFVHDGWREITDSFASTNYDWGRFLSSLKSYCENGEGKPS